MEYTEEKAWGYAKEKNHLGFMIQRDLPGLLAKYVKPGARTLDYGCGAGSMIPLLKRAGLNVEGMDISANMLCVALHDHKNTAFTRINSAAIPRPDASYDLVMLSYVLVEIASLSEMKAVIREVKRVLKPDGVVVVTVSSERKFHGNWLMVNNNFPENRTLTSGCRVKCSVADSEVVFEDFFWTDEDYRLVFSQSGLSVLGFHQPLGKPEDGMPWKDELHSPLFSIYVLGR
ncbi:bifunctional 2-polyprenyl-6-hydroxyphenol methylase/3-demethylubiquinol 3-O-methyltransferase UbiG [Endozoicomonas sp. ONNA1]|uniref:class I SAM-dependent methyltransferase n=1 Tax=Endozoicomonas sp. ONNA1 TaxID=2828740 RepID=UPI002148DDA0|nr:class I SAM-dependent methyltransferase [Endozoicomonas sp. ONNA1]